MSDEVLKDIWPQERDLLMRPERYRYVRRLVKNQHCVFCQAAEKGVSFESLLLHQTEHALFILNKYPYNAGHVLVLPRRHCGRVMQLSEAEYQGLSHALRFTVDALEKVYQCDGLNVGLNQGRVAGAGLPEHLHWHVIPRWTGDTNFFPVIAETKVLAETLQQSYDKIKAQLK